MSLLIGFLTLVLVLNCLFLMLLVLIQLPKKEAGAGIAFGGGATDALFGAGSGNALTKLTKYSATLFVGLALALTVLNAQRKKATETGVEKMLNTKAPAAAVLPAPKPASNQVLQLQPNAAPAPAAATTALSNTAAAAQPALKAATNPAAPKK